MCWYKKRTDLSVVSYHWYRSLLEMLIPNPIFYEPFAGLLPTPPFPYDSKPECIVTQMVRQLLKRRSWMNWIALTPPVGDTVPPSLRNHDIDATAYLVLGLWCTFILLSTSEPAYEQFHLANIRDSIKPTTTSSGLWVSLQVASWFMSWRFASTSSPF